MEKYILSFVLSMFPILSEAAGVLIEAESFSDRGGWVLDQQFMDIMGSPYLMAHGMGVPVSDASTTVEISESGVYHIYARTFNWTSPWSGEQGPGKFMIAVGKRRAPNVLGSDGDRWMWQYAGSLRLEEGAAVVSLIDLTGFNGRCDAVYMTTEKGDIPPSEGEELELFRRKMLRLTDSPETVDYDFVVVGGGIAGMCAAAAAARGGLRVALVNDRPVLGGNNSSEVRVHLGGYSEIGPYEALGRIIREFGHSRAGNARPAEYYEDSRKQQFIDGEENITLYPCFRAVNVMMAGSRISAVLVRNTVTSEEYWLRSPLFSDCTGDGNLGFLAGADWRMGRESRSEFGESLAPEVADLMTMGASVQWYSRDDGYRTTFPEFSYGIVFDDENCEEVTMGEWKWETGMSLDQIYDAERIRDYGLMVIFSNWSYLKNHKEDNARWACRSLDWVAYIAGKRESRRLMGDYILKQDDIDKNVFHEDATFTTTWSIDLHFPDPENSLKFPGAEFKAATVHNWIHPYAVPYRCLYSRNVDNLFMAGRNISTTHVALGTVRVMRTTGMMGEVVGMAAAVCHDHSCTPRQVYWYHLDELKEAMERGAGKDEQEYPDNQKFNLPNTLLEVPRAFMQK